MATREELHKLVDSLPEAAFETAQQMLTRFQIWPPLRPPRPPEFERFREEARERLHQSVQGKPGVFGMGGGGNFDPTRGSGSMGSSYWEDDTFVADTSPSS